MNSKKIQKIKQQEATIEMLSQLVSAKRARPEKLESAVNELNRLKSELVESTTEKPMATVRSSRLVTAIQKDVSGDIFALKQSALSQEASRLRRDQAELSNMLHKVSPEQPCPELVDKILELHHEIEGIWDQKKFLDRNQHDGPAEPAHDQQLNSRSVGAVENKAELSVRIQQLREKRSKLKKKLENPKATPTYQTKWQIEIAQVDAAIEEANTKRALL